MNKAEAKAYGEVLDNLKRDLAEVGNQKDVSKIKEKLKSYASGVFTKEGDELIVIPSSALKEILGETNKTDCPTCKHFILCSLEKQIFYKNTGYECDEYEEANNDR